MGGHAPGAEETPSGESCALNGSEGKGSTTDWAGNGYTAATTPRHGTTTTTTAFKDFTYLH